MRKYGMLPYIARLVGAVCLVGTFTVHAAVLTTSISTPKLSVGDRVRFTVTTIVPKGAVVTPPSTESGFGTVTVKEWNLHKTELAQADSLVYDYIITTYTPEQCTIPRLSFLVGQGGTVDTLHTEAFPLQIQSVLPSDTVDIMDLKTPLSAGKPPRWWLWCLVILGGGAILAVAGVMLYRHFRKTPPPPPPVPPYEEAIEALANLGVKKYLQRGLVREYVFELSDIFKRYIGRRFDCNAMDYTTEEMVAWTGARNLSKELRTLVEWFFRAADPVKFARLVPDSQTIERFDRDVRAFLEATRPILDKPVEEPIAPAPDSGSQPFTPEKGVKA